MSTLKKRNLTGHIKILVALFSLPLLVLGTEKYMNENSNHRTPASVKEVNEPIKGFVDPHKNIPSLFDSRSEIRKAAKSNSTFGFKVQQEILDYDESTEIARVRVFIDFESFIDSNSVNISWKIPREMDVINGRVTEEFHPMRVGEVNSIEMTLEGNIFESGAMFIEVSSVVNDLKLGAVNAVELKLALEKFLSAKELGDQPAPDKKNIFKAEDGKQYKIIY